ncbi:MAG TPA: EamA family transporter, partial [Arenicellales bacterium]|nr:EamA family transporter [Arenicellales bacterium]
CNPSALTTATCVHLTTAAFFCWLVVLAFEEVHVAFPPPLIWTFLSLPLGVPRGGMAFYLYMLKTGTAGKVAANFYITPGLTALLGWLILGETLSLNVLAGFALAIVGLWMVHRRELA